MDGVSESIGIRNCLEYNYLCENNLAEVIMAPIDHGHENPIPNYSGVFKRIAAIIIGLGILSLMVWSLFAIPWPFSGLIVSLELTAVGGGLFYMALLADE